MRASAVLIAIGVGLIGLQLFWPLRLDPIGLVSMAPLTLGAVVLAGGLVVGLSLGNVLYRRAIGIGILGIAVAVYGLGYATSGQPGVPPPEIRPSLVMFLGGIGICVLAATIALVALWRSRRSALP